MHKVSLCITVMQMNLPCGRVLHKQTHFTRVMRSQNPFHQSSAQPKPISPLQALFRRGQLKALVDLHSETEGLGGQLAAEEINVIRGALDLTNKTAAKGMTPLEKVRRLGYTWHALRKGMKRQDYTFLHQSNKKPSTIPGCPVGMR